jgi:putative hydrolase of HD superfamily
MIDDAPPIVAFLHEAGHLRHVPRTGWALGGAPNPESVAEHSFGTAVIAYVIAACEGADPDRAATLAVFHDVPETRIGDVPSVGKPYIQTAPAAQVIADQTAGLPAELAGAISRLVTEFADRSTPEARCAKDADRLDCLLRARVEQSRGHHNMQPWVDTSLAGMQTATGRLLGTAAAELPVNLWWRSFAEGYGATERPDIP